MSRQTLQISSKLLSTFTVKSPIDRKHRGKRNFTGTLLSSRCSRCPTCTFLPWFSRPDLNCAVAFVFLLHFSCCELGHLGGFICFHVISLNSTWFYSISLCPIVLQTVFRSSSNCIAYQTASGASIDFDLQAFRSIDSFLFDCLICFRIEKSTLADVTYTVVLLTTTY